MRISLTANPAAAGPLVVVALVVIVVLVVQPPPAVGATCGALLLALGETLRRLR